MSALRREKALEVRRLKAERDTQSEELTKYVQQCENDSKVRPSRIETLRLLSLSLVPLLKERQAIRTILEVK